MAITGIGMGIGVIGLVGLLGICALIVVALRKGSWKTLVALPLGMLLFLGIGSIFLADVRTSWQRVQVPATAAEPMPYAVHSEWSAKHDGDADAARLATQVLIEAQRNELRTAEQSVVQTTTRARVFILMGMSLIVAAGVVTLLIIGRKWIARNAGMLLAFAGIGFVGLLVLGVPSVMYVAEDSRRAEQVERLRAIGESFHHASSSHPRLPVARPEPAVPPAPTEVVLATELPAASSSDITVIDAGSVPTPAVESPAASATPAVELPDWITAFAENPRDFSATGTTVLVSDQWATVQESEQQLEGEATLLLAARLRGEHPEVRGWRPSNDTIHQSNAISRRFVESTTLRVGEFDAPMYRSYWQIEYTPRFASAAFSAWKQFAVRQRLEWLGGGTAGLTLLFALAAAALRFDSATGGRYRGRLTFAAVGLCTTLGGALLLLA